MMDELEPIANRAAASVRREADRLADADRYLVAVQRAGGQVDGKAHAHDGRRWRAWYTLAGIATAEAAAAVLLVMAGGGSDRVSPGAVPLTAPPAPVPATTSVPPTPATQTDPPTTVTPARRSRPFRRRRRRRHRRSSWHRSARRPSIS